ncbi:MAG TPA: tRNA-uridine aminocarboxypropyltransferase [Stellaceae bacterium]|nr:tRNA-uridine aminocarboxypropyltransferase [Stellaceae bacterium]
MPRSARHDGGYSAAMEGQIDNRVFVLILQHPQERREPLSTAPLVGGALRRSKVAVGLSWPGLARVLGEPAEPRHWGALYLGPARLDPAGEKRELAVLDRHGEPVAEPQAILAGLHGIVLLDGTWSQAKTLWWRNPWLLRLHRLVLDPPHPARLGRLRREPRRDALSTIEAAALALRHLEAGAEASDALIAALDRMMATASPRR